MTISTLSSLPFIKSSLSSSSLSRTAKTWWWKTFFSPSSPLVSKWLFSHCLYMVHSLTFFAVEPTSLSTTFSSLSFFTVVSDVRLIWRKIDTHGFDVRLRSRADYFLSMKILRLCFRTIQCIFLGKRLRYSFPKLNGAPQHSYSSAIQTFGGQISL